MSELPKGWLISSLGDIAGKGQYGWTTKASSKGSVRFLRTTDITKREVNWPAVPFCEEPPGDLSKFILKAGDIVISRAGSVGFNKLITSVPEMAVFASYLIRFRPSKAIDPKFLAAYLKSDDYWNGIKSASAGIALANVNAANLAQLPIPLPPLAEQTRIANQLDTLLIRIQSCNDRFDAIPALLKRFRQAVLSAGTTGALTADWRGSDSTESWDTCTIGQVLNGKPRNGYSPQAADYETPIRSLTLSATTTGKFLAQHSKFIDEAIPEDSYLWLEPGDILIQRANSLEHVGVSAIFDGDAKQFIYPDLMMRCRPNERIKSKYLFYALSAESTRDYFRKNATGTAGNMPKINQQTVMSAPLLLPPMDEQAEIVRRVEALFALADRIEARATAARTQAQRLTPLVLSKAFRGELVPQDANDEPADALLIRIASSTTAVAGKNKRKVPVAQKEIAQAAIDL